MVDFMEALVDTTTKMIAFMVMVAVEPMVGLVVYMAISGVVTLLLVILVRVVLQQL